MTSLEFRPQYDDTVREYYRERPDIPTVDVRPSYCLMPISANQLAVLLADLGPKIDMRPPWPQSIGSPWAFTHLVPWFIFADGTERNAALLAGYWTMAMNGNYPLSKAMDYCRGDIAGTF